jgi:hypothetical protein
MPSAQAAVDSFLHGIEAAPPLWRSIHLRTVAVRVEGTWRNVVTRCRLDPRVPADVPRVDVPCRGALAAWDTVLPIDALADLLDPLVDGELWVAGARVLCWRDEAAAEDAASPDEASPETVAESGPYTGSHRLVDVSRDPFASRSGWSEHALDLTGGPVDALLAGVSPRQMGIDRAMDALRRPRGDLAGWARLAQDVLAPGSSRPASLEVVAPFAVRLDGDGCSLRAGTLRVALSAPSRSVLSFASVDVVPSDGAAPGRASIAADSQAWVREGSSLVLRGPVSVAGAGEVEVVLRVGGVRVDAQTVRDGTAAPRSARVAAYAFFDPGLENLRASLFPLFPSQAADFDTAVLRLLGLAGLHVDASPGPRRAGLAGAGALVHAVDPDAALLVECSAGMAGGEGRLERLRERALRVSGALGRPLLPVMATALDRGRLTAAERERAAASGIALLGREQLDRILRMCLDAEPAQEVVAYVASYAAPAPGAGAGWTGIYPREGDDEQVPLPLV